MTEPGGSAKPYAAIDLAGKFARFSEHWSPRIVARMNGYHFKLVKIQGEFVWHSHAEIFVVPKGVEHKPSAGGECRVMLVEPAGTINTGDRPGALTAADQVWI